MRAFWGEDEGCPDAESPLKEKGSLSVVLENGWIERGYGGGYTTL
jgi:hypothetical protein